MYQCCSCVDLFSLKGGTCHGEYYSVCENSIMCSDCNPDDVISLGLKDFNLTTDNLLQTGRVKFERRGCFSGRDDKTTKDAE